MVVHEIEVIDVLAVKAKHQPPVTRDGYAPISLKAALQRVHAKTGEREILRALRHVKGCSITAMRFTSF